MLSQEERAVFNVCIDNIDMDQWVLYSVYGIHKFILK
jgi:hypothetical protein